jgi:hypothetical protein
MKTAVLLKTALMLLVIALAAVMVSWATTGSSVARAEGGGGSAAGDWMMVSAQTVSNDGMIYLFNAEKETLLIYAYYRRSNPDRGTSRVTGDLEFLAGRHCKWDLLYSQVAVFPYAYKGQAPPSGVIPPATMKKGFLAVTEHREED